MEYRIERIDGKLLVGIKQEMSYIDNKTALLWKSFMPFRNEVSNRVDNRYYSMQIYEDAYDYGSFDPATRFIKWAAVEVKSVKNIPANMGTYHMAGGMYAVFVHIGPASEFMKSMSFIFDNWLPQSGYKIDKREHFEILEEGYSPVDENAREEIWVPIIKI